MAKVKTKYGFKVCRITPTTFRPANGARKTRYDVGAWTIVENWKAGESYLVFCEYGLHFSFSVDDAMYSGRNIFGSISRFGTKFVLLLVEHGTELLEDHCKAITERLYVHAAQEIRDSIWDDQTETAKKLLESVPRLRLRLSRNGKALPLTVAVAAKAKAKRPRSKRKILTR